MSVRDSEGNDIRSLLKQYEQDRIKQARELYKDDEDKLEELDQMEDLLHKYFDQQ